MAVVQIMWQWMIVNWTECESKSRVIVWGTILAFSWRDCENLNLSQATGLHVCGIQLPITLTNDRVISSQTYI
jgi:hypothetical protein